MNSQTQQKYDVIGDIHGQANELEALLKKMGYRKNNGIYAHPEHKVIFLGDFIDRGLHEKHTIEICRPMVESGAALAVMGNHEFNAICYATPNPKKSGDYLRSHAKPGNTKSHQAFLNEYPLDTTHHADVIAWFKTLPVYLDLGEIRVIHASWQQEDIDAVQEWLDDQNCLLPEAYYPASERGHRLYDAIEHLLKGVEVKLPEGISFRDKDQKVRTKARIRWWNTQAKTLADLAIGIGGAQLPNISYTNERFHYRDQVPLFIGHYWLSGQPEKLTEYVACVDYSVAKQGGRLAAYRWQGESILDNSHFIWVERKS